jgi:hypothetical protein
LGLGFTSNGRDNSSTVVDLKTLKAINKVMTGGNPDAILYEPVHHEVYTFNGSGQSATVFEAKTGTVIATIPLMGKPEAAAFDRAVNRIYVNIEDKNEIAVIDVVKHVLVATWPLKGCDEPTGLGFDEKNHRLFSACGNQVMVATDSRTGRLLAMTAIGRGADGAAFDPGPGYALSSNGEGTMSVQKFDGNSFTLVETVKTQASARTMILDVKTHTVYLPAATMVAPAGGRRAQAQPDSFHVLVFRPEVAAFTPAASARSGCSRAGAIDAQAAAVLFRDPACDREAESAAARDWAPEPDEAFEHAVLFGGRECRYPNPRPTAPRYRRRGRSATRTCPPSGACRMPLSSRFITSCRSSPSSPRAEISTSPPARSTCTPARQGEHSSGADAVATISFKYSSERSSGRASGRRVPA